MAAPRYFSNFLRSLFIPCRMYSLCRTFPKSTVLRISLSPSRFYSVNCRATVDRRGATEGSTQCLLSPKLSIRTECFVRAKSSTADDASQADCWKCGRKMDPERRPFFCSCGVIQPPAAKSHFQIMGVEEKFDIDTKELTRKFRDLQRVLHPDKFSQKSETEKEYSAEQSSLVNKAYTTLLKPLSRGLYLLHIREEDLEKDIEMEPEFLGEIMELNEALIETDTLDEVQRLDTENSKVLTDLVVAISKAFKQGDMQAAKTLLYKVKYYANIDDKIREFISTHSKHL